MKKNILETSGITLDELFSFVSIHNTIISATHPFKYMLKVRKDITDVVKVDWFKDAVILLQLIKQLKVSPRTYILSQISMYKKPNRKAREVPTLKMMSSQKGIERYEEYLRHVKQATSVYVLTDTDMDMFSDKKMKTLMAAYDIESTEEFFRDVFLSSQLSRHFILNHPVYNSLKQSGFYKKEFGTDFPFQVEGE